MTHLTVPGVIALAAAVVFVFIAGACGIIGAGATIHLLDVIKIRYPDTWERLGSPTPMGQWQGFYRDQFSRRMVGRFILRGEFETLHDPEVSYLGRRARYANLGLLAAGGLVFAAFFLYSHGHGK